MEAARTAYEREMDNLRATELRLGLPGTEEPQKPAPAAAATRPGVKRALAPEVDEEGCRSMTSSTCTGSAGSSTEDDCPEAAAPPAKAQVVGWPPIRSYRKNCLQARKAEAELGPSPGLYVKVSMDGAPYLRKIDLNVFRGYKELREALEAMFKCFSMGFSAGEAQPTADYAITYQDKDGDWMLAGDVPWEMFTSSCRRLRIMRGSEARGFGSSS